MTVPTIFPGDILFKGGSAPLEIAIEAVETVQEGKIAIVNHVGIFVDSCGNTIEALWRVTESDVNDYVGDRVIIGRWKGMTQEGFNAGMLAIQEALDEKYPWWRLGMFLLLPKFILRKMSNGKNQVCSELAAKFLKSAGCPFIENWEGVDPQDLLDLFTPQNNCDIIYRTESWTKINKGGETSGR